jgi:hypothetical protein
MSTYNLWIRYILVQYQLHYINYTLSIALEVITGICENKNEDKNCQLVYREFAGSSSNIEAKT